MDSTAKLGRVVRILNKDKPKTPSFDGVFFVYQVILL